MYPIASLSIHEEKFNLDMGLFRALCIYNLSGNVSFNQLKTWATGYGLRRFTIEKRVMQNPHITYELIDIHVILCKMTMYKVNYTRR